MFNDKDHDTLRKSYVDVVKDLTRISDEYYTDLKIFQKKTEHLVACCFKFEELCTELYETNETIKGTEKGKELKATLDNLLYYFMNEKNLDDLNGGKPVLPVKRVFIPNKTE